MIRAYHFVGKTLRDGSPIPKDGEWLRYRGKVRMCEAGLHASRHVADALNYAPGATLCLVDMSRDIVESDDKLVARCRRIVARFDATELLFADARASALSVAHLWDMPDTVRQYLETGNLSLRSEAWSAARNAAESAAWSAAESAAESAVESAAWNAAWNAARSAAWSAAESEAWSAARSAARSAAESAAWSAAEGAAWSAARSAAWSAARSAAWSAARSAAWSAARSAAWSAARDRLQVSVDAKFEPWSHQ
jgi:hypothetical protein